MSAAIVVSLATWAAETDYCSPNEALGPDTIPSLPVLRERPYKALAIVAPDVPMDSNQTTVNGSVSVSFDINLNGRVENITIKRSDNPSLEAAVRSAIQKWRFTPEVAGCVMVPVKGLSALVKFQNGVAEVYSYQHDSPK